MPPVSQYIAGVKLAGLTIGAIIGGIIFLAVLPFLLFGSFLFFQRVWYRMFRDRAQYLVDEKRRAAWNAEARREEQLRLSAMALLRQWARKNGVMAEGSLLNMSILVSGN